MRSAEKRKGQKFWQRFSKRQSSIVDKGLKIQVGEYTIHTIDSIGKGSYGEVYKAYKQEGEVYACKVIRKSQLERLQVYDHEKVQKLRKRFTTEISFHKSLSDIQNVVRLYEMLQDQRAYYLFMQLCEEDLSKYLNREGALSQTRAWGFFRQLVTGYQSIFNRNAFHRDLKVYFRNTQPQNLLILNETVKISDFGFVKVLNEVQSHSKTAQRNFKAESIVGSIKYMSPDILMTELQNKGYNPQKSDIWSMGVILYRMLYGKEPFQGKTQIDLIKQISQKEISFDYNMDVSQEKIELMGKMMHRDQNIRISFKKLLEEVRIISQHDGQLLSTQSKQIVNYNKEHRPFKKHDSKEKVLSFLNTLNKNIYHDAVNYATLRQIGFDDGYLIYSYKLMTLIHQKRLNCLQNEDNDHDDDVNQDIKKQIAQYHNIFYLPIKIHSKVDQNQTLQDILPQFIQKLNNYKDYYLLSKSVQLYLLDLMMLYNLFTDKMTIEEVKDVQGNIKDIQNWKEGKKQLIKMKERIYKVSILNKINTNL